MLPEAELDRCPQCTTPRAGGRCIVCRPPWKDEMNKAQMRRERERIEQDFKTALALETDLNERLREELENSVPSEALVVGVIASFFIGAGAVAALWALL